MVGDDKLMRWTPQLFTAAFLGLAIGLFLAMWLDMVRPWLSGAVMAPIGFWVIWRCAMRDDHR